MIQHSYNNLIVVSAVKIYDEVKFMNSRYIKKPTWRYEKLHDGEWYAASRPFPAATVKHIRFKIYRERELRNQRIVYTDGTIYDGSTPP